MHFTRAVGLVFGWVGTVSASQLFEQLNGTSIPISKWVDYNNVDDSMNPDVLGTHVSLIEAKVRRGFDRHSKYAGVKKLLSARKNNKLAGSAIIRLDRPSPNVAWYGVIRFGSTTKNVYRVVFDTASADVIIATTACDNTCDGLNRWSPGRSITAEGSGEECLINYSDGSKVSGTWYTENLSSTTWRVVANEQAVCGAASYPTMFQYPTSLADGVVGMGFQSISACGSPPFIQTLFEQGQLTNPSFSFKFTYPPELYLGGANTAYYVGDFTFVPVSHVGFWVVPVDHIQVNTQIFAQSASVIIDTSCLAIVGPTSQVAALQSLLSGTPAPTTFEPGFYVVPCNHAVPVSIMFGGTSFTINPEHLTIRPVTVDSPNCISAIVGRDLVDGLDLWVFGYPFLANVYSTFVFDPVNPLVGFATLA